MLGSRVLADVPVTRLVAKRQLVGLTAQDLRFTPQEIQGLLQVSHIKVSETQAEVIAANSEGWITGVLLLADLLRQGVRETLLDSERATAETYDYLAREVLSLQPPDIQQFLRTSAVLREMSVRLCREILQIVKPRALLAEVERRNLFVTRFGRDTAATYRYHNLFRDFLQEQLRQGDPDRYGELHRRAAERFERDNDVEEAVYHYLAAEDYPDATAMMERVAMEWFTRGRVETLLRWAGELPEQAKVQAPRLSFYQSTVLGDRYDYDGARKALAHAEAGFAAQRDTARLAMVHIRRGSLGLFEGRYEDAIAEAQTALGMLEHEGVAAQAEAERLIGKAHVGLGRLAQGVAKLQDALVLYREFGSPYDVVNLLQDLVSALTAQGRFGEASVCLNEALAIGRRLGAPTLLAGVLNNAGWLHYIRGEYRDALALYEEGLAAARRGGVSWLQTNIVVGMADLYRDVGAYQRAASLYKAGWQMAQGREPGLAVYILAAQADMYRWQGDHPQALASLEQANQLAQEKGLGFEERGLLPMAEGIALAEGGEVEAGLGLLADAVCFLEQRQAKRELARARFLLAKAHWLAGDRPQALAELGRTMDLAEEIGTDQFAVVEGQHAEALLRLGTAAGVPGCRHIAETMQQLRVFTLGKGQTLEGTEEGPVGHMEIYAFGEGRVVRDGHTVTSSEWQAAMAKELFFYVLLHGPLERDALGVIFWPDLSTRKMADSFHTTLYRIRRAVGAEAVVMEGGRYRIGDIDHWFDVEEFEALIGRARLLPPHDWQAEDLWRRAVALYQGDFLIEVERVWCVPKREQLREMYVEALIGVGRCHEARREFQRAIGWYRRALEVNELREDVHRRIMHCYAEAGRRSEALAQYLRCQEFLRQDLNIEPSSETKRLYQRIAGTRPD
jgi:DNA-binding SARP family transcriptional activator